MRQPQLPITKKWSETSPLPPRDGSDNLLAQSNLLPASVAGLVACSDLDTVRAEPDPPNDDASLRGSRRTGEGKRSLHFSHPLASVILEETCIYNNFSIFEYEFWREVCSTGGESVIQKYLVTSHLMGRNS